MKLTQCFGFQFPERFRYEAWCLARLVWKTQGRGSWGNWGNHPMAMTWAFKMQGEASFWVHCFLWTVFLAQKKAWPMSKSIEIDRVSTYRGSRSGQNLRSRFDTFQQFHVGTFGYWFLAWEKNMTFLKSWGQLLSHWVSVSSKSLTSETDAWSSENDQICSWFGILICDSHCSTTLRCPWNEVHSCIVNFPAMQVSFEIIHANTRLQVWNIMKRILIEEISSVVLRI